MPVNKPDNFVVALGEMHRSNRDSAIEPGKVGGFHPATIPKETEEE